MRTARMIKSVMQNTKTITQNRVGRILRTPALPKNISLSVTWKCNSRCATCGIWRAPLSKEDIEPEIYEKNLLTDPLLKQVHGFEITGGEPMLYDGIFDLTAIAIKQLPKNTVIRIGTNAIADERLEQYLYAFHNEPLHISLSIDGIGDRHDNIRGIPGNFQKVSNIIEIIKELQGLGSPLTFGASVCVSSLNIDHIPELTKWLVANEVGFQLTPVIFPDYAQNKHARSDKSELDFITIKDKEQVSDLFEQYERETYQIFCDFWNGRKYPQVPCYALREFMVIYANGDVVTCQYKHLPIGNLRNNTISEIWKSETTQVLRKQLRACTACNRIHPNLCDSLNNYTYHGTLILNSYQNRIKRKLGI